jgi:D-alanine transaminase
MPDVLWINGRFTTTDEPVIRVEDRGFQFGDGVYEVFKFLGRRPVFLAEHYERMERGLTEIDIANPWLGRSTFAAVVLSLLERTAFDDGIVYIQVTRGAGERSHFYAEDLVPTAIAYSRRFTFPDAAKKERGIRVITTSDLRWKMCNIKSVSLLANALAKKKAQRAGAEEVVLVDDGLVREGASSNFFGVRRGSVVTHPLDPHILPGVVRDRTIALALGAKIRVDERPLREAELFDLDEAFITSTTMGVMPVTAIDDRPVGSGRRGSVTAELQGLFDALEVSAPEVSKQSRLRE